MNKKNKLPTDKEIKAKLDSFSSLIDKVVDGEVKLKTKRETVADKLELLKEQLLKLKDKSIPYSTLSKLIEDEIGLKVSEQTLRSYCQEKLGFPKKGYKTAALRQPVLKDAKSQLSDDEDFE
ncbi:TPA: hypothetical protein ACX6QG_003742 [Photobacterium damselae]